MIVIIANIIDFIAAGIQVVSGSIKNKAKILIVQIVQLLMQGLSMLMLGGITGAISNVLSCFRNFLCYKEKLNWFWKIFLIVLSVVMTIALNDQGWLGIIPAATCAIYIILMDVKDPIKFKLLVTLSFAPWVVYHFAIQAYVAGIFDIATIITNGVTLYLMIRKKNKSELPPT